MWRQNQLVVGDIVLIKEDTNLPRSLGRAGRVVKLVIGNDNNVRGTQLDTVTKTGRRGIAHRPLVKLIPFEIAQSSPDTETYSADPETSPIDPEPSSPGITTASPVRSKMEN